MSISTKSRPTSNTYTSNIYDLTNNKDVSGLTILPDGTALVKVSAKEILQQQAAFMVMISNLFRNIKSGELESRKPEEKTETRLTREEKSKTGEGPVRKTRRRREPTKTQKRQLRDFKAFLKAHPVVCGRRKCSIGARANRFWHLNWKKLETEARQTGSYHGYKNARCLADGARKAGLQWSDNG